MSRLSKDKYFMKMAHLVSQRATCIRRQVGAVLIRDSMVISTGYNGAPKGLPHCIDHHCIRNQNGVKSGERLELCRATHAEANAIVQAASIGVSTKGAKLYCTLAPCPLCACLIINSGIEEVVYGKRFSKETGLIRLESAGIEVAQYSGVV